MPVAPERFSAPESSRAIAARVEERPDELLREERVPLGGREEPPGEVVRELAASGRELHEGPVLGGRERAERERGEAGIAAEGLQHLHEGMPLVDLRLPVGPDDERRRRAEAPRDVLERLDRELRPVQLLEDEEERLAAGDPREGAGDQLEDRDLVLGLPPSPALTAPESLLAAARSSPISERTGKSARRSPARSEKSGREVSERPASFDRK